MAEDGGAEQRTPHPRLEVEWDTLLEALGVLTDTGRVVFAELVRQYSQPDRHYHNLEHLEAVLETVHTLRHLTRHLPAVQAAAWFHDAIYDPQAHDNEERSAEQALNSLEQLGAPPALLTSIPRLILLTKSHVAGDEDPDGQVLLDADLAILGAPPDQYDAYARAIRREYAWVPEEGYRAGRARVLANFLERPRVYFTQPMFAACEARARSNLEREIAALR